MATSALAIPVLTAVALTVAGATRYGDAAAAPLSTFASASTAPPTDVMVAAVVLAAGRAVVHGARSPRQGRATPPPRNPSNMYGQ